jgi:hypothetical protein
MMYFYNLSDIIEYSCIHSPLALLILFVLLFLTPCLVLQLFLTASTCILLWTLIAHQLRPWLPYCFNRSKGFLMLLNPDLDILYRYFSTLWVMMMAASLGI